MSTQVSRERVNMGQGYRSLIVVMVLVIGACGGNAAGPSSSTVPVSTSGVSSSTSVTSITTSTLSLEESQCLATGGQFLPLETVRRCIQPGGVASGSFEVIGVAGNDPDGGLLVWNGPGAADSKVPNEGLYQEVGVIPPFAVGVTATGHATPDGLWYYIQYGSFEGWARSAFLAPQGSSVSTTTSTAPAPVTVEAGLPSALSRSSIPAASIDQGWVVALYSAAPDDMSTDGTVVVYLVSPSGDRYELAVFPAGSGLRPVGVGNLANSGEHAFLVGWDPAAPDRRTILSIAVPSGTITQVKSFDFTIPAIGSTLPTGRDVVMSRTTAGQSGEDILDVYRQSGALFSEIVRRPVDYPPLSWLYALDGTELLVGESDGIHVYSNQGVDTRMLAALPGGGVCAPVRWWDSTTVLASCVPQWVATANGSYGVLWLFPFDGSAPTRLTVDPPVGFPVVDYGHANAWKTSGGTVLQWWGDGGFRVLHLLGSGGSSTPIAYQGAGQPWVIAQSGNDLVVHATGAFGLDFGPLLLVRPDGSVVRELVPQVPGRQGVTSVAGMIPTP